MMHFYIVTNQKHHVIVINLIVIV